MKQNYTFKRMLSAVLLLLASTFAWAYDFEAKNADGVTIYYNLINGGNVEVTSKFNAISDYMGVIVIPPTVTYKGNTYSVTSIGHEAFFYCSGLTSVNIPNSVTSIGVNAFKDCNSLTSIIIPRGVTSIGDGAFAHCYGLTSITIPEGVKSIGDGAFQYCTGLTSVNIPEGVKSIGDGVLSFCSNLTSVIVDKSNPVYDSRDNCNAIIETASNTLIAGCQNTVIPEDVTHIGNDAFNGCIGLTFITIPESVTSIGDYAFAHCYGLTSINISKGVTSIGYRAFFECSSLPSIDIPESVASIGNGAFTFYSYTSLTTVICRAETVPELEWGLVFGAAYQAILYVPASALEDYKDADQWKDFANILPIEGEEEVTLAIGDAHYATFIAPFEVTIPTNVTAYTVSGIKEDGETLQLEKLTGTIPTNTPVVLYSNDIVNETVTGWRSTQGATYTYGLLTSVYYKEIQAPLYSYVLQNQNGKVAFYYVDYGWNQPTITANHAYLTVPEGANGVKALRFSKDDDETTGIQATMSDQESKAVIYDMTGRRVEKAVKGMYIIDGKKVMVK